MRRSCLAFLVLLLLAVSGAVAPAQDAEVPFTARLAAWNRVLDEVAAVAGRPSLTPEQVRQQRERLAALLSRVESATTNVNSALAPLNSQLAALGPPPGEDQPAESADVARQRASLNDQLAELQGQIKQAGVIETRATELESRLGAYVREVAVERLLDRFPYPLAPGTIAVAVPELFVHLGELLVAPVEWWNRLSDDQRSEVLYFRFTFILVFAVGFGWIARYLLLSRLGRRPEIEEPTYARRLTGAIAEGLGNGLIPALIFGGLLYRTLEGRSLFTGTLADMVVGLCLGMIILVMVRAMARAGLAPDLPAWRVEDIGPENARTIARGVTLLATVFAIDVFLVRSTGGLSVSQELESLYELCAATIESALLISLMRGRLWRLEPAPAEAQPEETAEAEAAPEARETSRFWALLRVTIVIVAVASVAAALLGYTSLSSQLLESLLISCGLVGGLYLIRGLFREVIGAALRSHLVQEQLGLRHATRNLLKFWTRALLDLAILAAGVVLLLPIWGVPLADMLRWLARALQGITIGNVTISITDLLAGLLVFTVIVVLTRLIQRLLAQRVLPQTTLDSGVQNSLTAGLGYVGIALAAALGIATVGLDLSNLAIIAGALSVGIGFGLQNVVNNFVSGVILLIERPIKVGDWIIAAGHEGYVKRINVRATELETFQRASVIIPNSELISSSVVNWTHKNKLGRVEVPVGVAYGSDIELVMQTLKDCLKADSRILQWPEPYVLFRGFGDSSLDFEARGYIGDVEWVIVIASDLRVAIAAALAGKGIEIPFPQRDVHLKDIDKLVAAIDRRGAGAPEDDDKAEDDEEAGSGPRRPRRRRRPPPAETDIGGEGEGDG